MAEGMTYETNEQGQTFAISPTGGRKEVKNERYDLIPVGPLRDLAIVYGEGAKKYADHNWRKGYPISQSIRSLQSHLEAFKDGHDLDDGPGGIGVKHMAQVAWHAFTILELLATHPEYDDRYSTVLKREKEAHPIAMIETDGDISFKDAEIFKNWFKEAAANLPNGAPGGFVKTNPITPLADIKQHLAQGNALWMEKDGSIVAIDHSNPAPDFWYFEYGDMSDIPEYALGFDTWPDDELVQKFPDGEMVDDDGYEGDIYQIYNPEVFGEFRPVDEVDEECEARPFRVGDTVNYLSSESGWLRATVSNLDWQANQVRVIDPNGVFIPKWVRVGNVTKV